MYLLSCGSRKKKKSKKHGSKAKSSQELLSELELELIQSHMAQKQMLRGEVGARALRVRSDLLLLYEHGGHRPWWLPFGGL